MANGTNDQKMSDTASTEHSVYRQCSELLDVSTLIYGVADLRDLARKGKLKGDPELIDELIDSDIPIEKDSARKLLSENKKVLLKKFGDKNCELYMKADESFHEAYNGGVSDTRFVVFDDENSKSELVYAIEVDDQNKKIIVIFRGSVTAKDWLQDAKAYFVQIPNPVQSGGYERVGIHAGFHEYLLDPKDCKEGGTENTSMFDKILSEVLALLKENPGYLLCSTGHSLGAALATLFAFMAAADPQTPKPVETINFASPRVGNTPFEDAFRTLEEEDKIRCLRVANHKDAITEMPDNHVVGCFLLPGQTFRHVGLELSLFKDKEHKFVYPRRAMFARRFLQDFQLFVSQAFTCSTLPLRKPIDHVANHKCQEYLKRLEKVSGALEKVKLGEVYNDHLKTR